MAKRKFDIGDTVYYIYKGKRHKSSVIGFRQYYDGLRRSIWYNLTNNVIGIRMPARKLKTIGMMLTGKIKYNEKV